MPVTSAEEMELLKSMLRRELDSANIQLHRTSHFEYKHVIERRIHTIEGLLEAFDRAGLAVPIT